MHVSFKFPLKVHIELCATQKHKGTTICYQPRKNPSLCIMGSRDDYKFLPVNDAIASIGQKVNLIGVVLDTGIPKRSKGTDFCVTIRIFDQSKPSPGISVNFFAESMDKLPQVGCCGDIIQLSHVVMKAYQTEIYALYYKKWSSFALFEGKHGTTCVPYQCSSSYHSRQQDRAFIDGLRKWLADHPEEMGSGDLLQLKDIQLGDQFNLVCKIVHISEVQKDEWILYVWDGTDTPALPIETRLEDELQNPLPLSLEPSPLPRDTFCTFPSVGTVLRMRIDTTGNEKLGIIDVLKVGKWIKFRNLLCEVRAGMWVATVMPFTRVCLLPDDDERALQKQRTYDERYSSKLGRMPMQCFPTPSNLTETDYPRVPFVSLMDILSYSEVTYKYVCVVRVVAILPWRAEDFRSPKGVYRIRLTLEDPTARLHAFLYDEDAVYFFNGYHAADVMTKRRNKLLGIAESEEEDGVDSRVVRRDPPWVQVGLKSYSIDANDVWGSRNYRVFATKFKDE